MIVLAGQSRLSFTFQSKPSFAIFSFSLKVNFRRMNISSEYGFRNANATTIIYSTVSDSREPARFGF